MALDIPFYLYMQQVAAANGTITMSYQVPTNQTLKLKEWRWSSTGIFSVYGIRDGAGRFYTNASAALPIPSTLLQLGSSSNIGLASIPLELTLGGGYIIFVDLKDTSAAPNTINLLWTGIMNVP